MDDRPPPDGVKLSMLIQPVSKPVPVDQHRENDSESSPLAAPHPSEAAKALQEVLLSGNAWKLRVIARAIDILIVVVVSNVIVFGGLVLLIWQSDRFSIDGTVLLVSLVLAPLVWFFGYYFVLELRFQRTLGKKILGFKVYDQNGNKPPARKILVRTVLHLFSMSYFIWVADLATMVFGHEHRTLIDRISGTKVIRKESFEVEEPVGEIPSG